MENLINTLYDAAKTFSKVLIIRENALEHSEQIVYLDRVIDGDQSLDIIFVYGGDISIDKRNNVDFDPIDKIFCIDTDSCSLAIKIIYE